MSITTVPLLFGSALLLMLPFLRDILIFRKDIMFAVLGVFMASVLLHRISQHPISLLASLLLVVAEAFVLYAIVKYENERTDELLGGKKR